MHGTAIVIYMYAGLLLLGGVVAFFKAESKASLVSSLLFGLALLESGLLVWEGKPVGLLIALALAGLLSMLMAWRFTRSRKFMPSGLVALLSLVLAVWLAIVLQA